MGTLVLADPGCCWAKWDKGAKRPILIETRHETSHIWMPGIRIVASVSVFIRPWLFFLKKDTDCGMHILPLSNVMRTTPCMYIHFAPTRLTSSANLLRKIDKYRGSVTFECIFRPLLCTTSIIYFIRKTVTDDGESLMENRDTMRRNMQYIRMS